jgi:DNA-binding transcriptional ArsR family regulator
MKSRDDELYTTMFNALRHGVRRKVLRILSKRKVSFTSLLNELEISSSHLTYHLDALGELITKDESKYTLSVFGKAAVEMMTNIEDPPRRYFQSNPGEVYKYAFTFLLTILVVASALMMNLVDLQATHQNIMEVQEAEIQSLTDELEPLKRFSELDTMIHVDPEVMVSSKAELSYISDSNGVIESYSDSILLLYAPENNKVLEVTLMANVPIDYVIPLSVQRGNAFQNETAIPAPEEYRYNESVEWMSKVLWVKQNTDLYPNYKVILPTKGWYTISLIGPITITEDGTPVIHPPTEAPRTWGINEYYRVWADCRLLMGRDNISFGFKTINTQPSVIP